MYMHNPQHKGTSIKSRTLIERIGLIGGLFILLFTFQNSFAIEYEIVDLGEGSGKAVNDLGHAVTNRSGVMYFYDGVTVTSIGDLGTGTVIAGGLNNSDEIVGTYRPTGSPSDTSVAYYDGTSWTTIGKFGGDFAYASDINDSGLITGAYKPGGSGYKAYIYDVATTDFSDLPSYSDGIAINANGWIAGTDENILGNESAYYYNGTTATNIDPIGGFINGQRGYGKDINSNGDVVGFSQDSLFAYHAFLYDGTDVTDLGTLGGTTSNAYAVNDAGTVVGYSLDGDGVQLAFVYDGTMTDLNSLVTNGSGWVLTDAFDINSDGVIVGEGQLNGATHAYLLNPVANNGTNGSGGNSTGGSSDNNSGGSSAEGSSVNSSSETPAGSSSVTLLLGMAYFIYRRRAKIKPA